MRSSIQFAIVNPHLCRETPAVYEPTSDTSNWLKQLRKTPPLPMEWCSGTLVNCCSFSLWTNHSVCPLISGVYLHTLVMCAHDTGNRELQLSRTHRRGLWAVLKIKPQTPCKALSGDGLKRLQKGLRMDVALFSEGGIWIFSNPESALEMGNFIWWLLQKFQAWAPPSTLPLTYQVLFAPNCSSLEIYSSV